MYLWYRTEFHVVSSLPACGKLVLMYLYSVYSLRASFQLKNKLLKNDVKFEWCHRLRSCMACIFCENTSSFVVTLGFFLSFVSKFFLIWPTLPSVLNPTGQPSVLGGGVYCKRNILVIGYHLYLARFYISCKSVNCVLYQSVQTHFFILY